MDDVLPGVIIDAVLGIDMNETDVFKGQLDDIVYYRSGDPGRTKENEERGTCTLTSTMNHEYFVSEIFKH